MKTESYNETEIERKWYVIDAKNQILGRLSSAISNILMGKNNPKYSPHVDAGDNVIVINARDIALSGNKRADKSYFSHSTYAGGGKTISFEQALTKEPAFPIRMAVRGMLPKNARGRRMIKKLHIYADSTHPHLAQKPEARPL